MTGSGAGRQIGPIGTSARTVGGAAAIVLPVALDGFSWWDAGIALLALPLIAAVAAPATGVLAGGIAPRTGSRPAVLSGSGCLLIVVMVFANSGLAALTPANGTVTLWVWLGTSMLLAAGRGYRGCEVLAFSNLITGRSDQIGCILYTPIDAAEERRRVRGPQDA